MILSNYLIIYLRNIRSYLSRQQIFINSQFFMSEVNTELLNAIKQGEFEIFEKCLKNGAEVNFIGEEVRKHFII